MNNKLIFDVGLHKGEDSEFYLKKGFKVVAIEADLDLATLAERRLAPYVESGQLVIVNSAIAAKSGPITFYKNERDTDWGTTFEAWADRNRKLGSDATTAVTVEGIRFKQLLERFECPYFMKIDIEGADLLCLTDLLEIEERPKYVSIESNKTSWKQLLREYELLQALGYSKFKVVDQGEVQYQKVPFPAREGGYADHRFEDGSSGMFGEEAPGAWLTRQEALRRFRRIFWRYRLFGDTGIFKSAAAILRRIPVLRRLSKYATVAWYDTHASR